MEARDKAGGFFLAVVLAHIILELVIYFTPFIEIFPWNMATNLLLSEAVIWLPAAGYFLLTKKNPLRTCRIRRVKAGTLGMTILFTVLCAPLTTLANAISMLFVENTVLAVSGSVLDMSFGLMFFLIAVYGPFVEEAGFRGIIYQGLRSRGNVWKAILLSALLFALMHMNLNQAAYAFFIGIMLALLMEATDSIWPGFLMHLCINGFSVVMMFFMDTFSQGVLETAAESTYTTQELFMVICVYFLLTVICTPLAVCVLVWMAEHENRREAFAAILPNRKAAHKRLFTIPLVIGIVICLGMMINW